MFDQIGKELVKSVVNSFLGGGAQKIKLEFQPPEGKMEIHHLKPDGSNHTYTITFKQIEEMITNDMS